VSTYKAVRSNPEAVYQILRQFPRGENAYYAVRDGVTQDSSGLWAAARFIYLNRFCFNGIYRTNMSGRFNVPYGGKGTGALPTLAKLQEVSRLLKRAELRKSDFESVLDMAERGDLVYIDPPYSVGNRRVFKQYGPAVFGLEDLRRLSAKLGELNNKGVSFVISYACCREAMIFFGSWSSQRKLTMRNVAGFSEHRRKAVEMIFTNISH
jgi:DNA adenine methylase